MPSPSLRPHDRGQCDTGTGAGGPVRAGSRSGLLRPTGKALNSESPARLDRRGRVGILQFNPLDIARVSSIGGS